MNETHQREMVLAALDGTLCPVCSLPGWACASILHLISALRELCEKMDFVTFAAQFRLAELVREQPPGAQCAYTRAGHCRVSRIPPNVTLNPASTPIV